MPDRKQEPIIAIGLLGQKDLDALGSGFHRAFPTEDVPFMLRELLDRIDEVTPEQFDET